MTFCSSFDMAAGSQQAAVTESLNASQDKCLYDKSSSWKFIFVNVYDGLIGSTIGEMTVLIWLFFLVYFQASCILQVKFLQASQLFTMMV